MAMAAPQDNVICAYVCYMWGRKPMNLLECLVMGGSHEQHGSKIQRILCADESTRSGPEHELLKAVWQIENVTEMEVPAHLKGYGG